LSGHYLILLFLNQIRHRPSKQTLTALGIPFSHLLCPLTHTLQRVETYRTNSTAHLHIKSVENSLTFHKFYSVHSQHKQQTRPYTMMTSAVNVFALSNLTLICRNGTEAVGRLSKTSPYLITKTADVGCTSSTPVPNERHTRPSSRRVYPAPMEPREQAPKNPAAQTPTQTTRASPRPSVSKKRSRSGGSVRFAPQTPEGPELTQQKNRAKKRRRFEQSDSVFWWSKGELKDIQQSCVSAVKRCESGLPLPINKQSNSIEENDLGSLDRYSSRNQKRRRLARSQMYETVKAVKAFEKATKTKAPPELLSQLLQRYSTNMVIEANNKGLRTAANCVPTQR